MTRTALDPVVGRRFSFDDAQLADETGTGVTVAVVDSGVHAEHPHIRGVVGGVGIDDAGGEVDDYVDRLGHGTAVAAVIKERVPEADLFAVRVFDRELSTTSANLARGVEWALERNVDIVNLSLGTTNLDRRPRFRTLLDRAAAQGAWIVSAAENEGRRWLPGSMHGAIGVVVDWTCPRCEVTVVRGTDGAVLSASGYPRPIPGVSPERNLRGVSFAVANATAFLVRVRAMCGADPGDVAACLLRV